MMRPIRKERYIYLAAFLTAVAAIGFFVYPHISDWYIRYTAEEEILDYDSVIRQEEQDSLLQMKEQAVWYNKRLAGEHDLAAQQTETAGEAEKVSDLTEKPETIVTEAAESSAERNAAAEDSETESEAVESETGLPSLADYDKMLAVTDAIGYLEIPKLDIYLPIYHGLEEKVLSKGIGHMPDSSLPVGGSSTHCVLSGHSGLPAAKLLTDLDQMETGDIFVLHVLDEVLTYEVDQISVVLPDDFSLLQIEKGEDYVTLLTCTPYGINSHRLLVRGSRTEESSLQMSLTAPEPETEKEISGTEEKCETDLENSNEESTDSGKARKVAANKLILWGAAVLIIWVAGISLLILLWPEKEKAETEKERKQEIKTETEKKRETKTETENRDRNKGRNRKKKENGKDSK